MSGYMVDTNILSEVVRKKPDAKVLARLRGTPAESVYTSAVCVMELRYGSSRHPRHRDLWARIERDVIARVQVIPIGVREAERAGIVLAALSSAGVPIGIEDTLIGSSALVHDMTLVTRNVRHFNRIEGLRVESWWA